MIRARYTGTTTRGQTTALAAEPRDVYVIRHRRECALLRSWYYQGSLLIPTALRDDAATLRGRR